MNDNSRWKKVRKSGKSFFTLFYLPKTPFSISVKSDWVWWALPWSEGKFGRFCAGTGPLRPKSCDLYTF